MLPAKTGALGKKLTGWLGAESDRKWSDIQLVGGHWCSSGSGLRPVLLNIFINNLGRGIKGTFSQMTLGNLGKSIFLLVGRP